MIEIWLEAQEGISGIGNDDSFLSPSIVPKGIRVNAVAPGAIRTPMHPVEAHGFLATMHPLGRMGEVREVVDAVLYLEDATFVTGEVMHVDGGAHAGHW